MDHLGWDEQVLVDYMQAVNEKWYIGYRWGTLVAGLIVLAYTIVVWFIPGLIPEAYSLNISYFTGAILVTQIVFALVAYGRVASNRSHAEAMILLAMLQAVVIFSLVQSTGRMESPFMVWWGLACLMSGMFGIYASAGTGFVTTVYFALSTTAITGQTTYTPLVVSSFVLLLLASISSHFFWRNRYTDQDSTKVANLRGELKTTQRQSEVLIQSLTDGVMLVDSEGVISLANPAAAKMTGWLVEDAIGTDYRSVVTLKKEDGNDFEDGENPLNGLQNLQDAQTSTVQLIDHNNKALVISLVVSPLKNAKTLESIGTILVMRDISVSHQSDKQRAEFISTASHEMRTPVAAIEGYLQLALNEKVSKVDPKAREFLTKALDSTHHLGQLFQDLLTSAKAEDGRLVSHPVVVELGEYIENLSDSFKFSAEKKGLLTDFILGTAGGATETTAGSKVVRPLYYVLADPDRLREVITNLFDNAVKYTPQGKVTLGLTGNNDVVQVFIRDTGPGIPAEDLPHLFQKFYRVDNSSTRTIGGTGLGLFISRKIIEMYKGRIWVESTLGNGSTFYINLPRLTTQKAEELRQAEAQNPTANPIQSLTTPV